MWHGIAAVVILLAGIGVGYYWASKVQQKAENVFKAAQNMEIAARNKLKALL